MITIKPCSGLANRMRALDSAVAVFPPGKEKLKLVWERNALLNCRFSDLFLVPGFVEVVEKRKPFLSKFERSRNRFFAHPLLKFHSGLFSSYDKILFEEDLSRLRQENYDFTQLCNYRSVYIETRHRFHSAAESYWYLKPVQEILSKVTEITNHLGSDTIGIHIRRTDNIKSIQASPLEAFIKMMTECLSKNQDTSFFLATDSFEVEKKLRISFPGRIFSNENRCLDRNSTQGIKDALIDMLCLSGTKRIIGSYWSSFTEVAAELTGIDVHVVNTMT